MTNYKKEIVLASFRQGHWGWVYVSLGWQLTFLVCFWALPDFFYIMTFSISLLHFGVVDFFSFLRRRQFPSSTPISYIIESEETRKGIMSAYSKASSNVIPSNTYSDGSHC